ncbi:MAG: hypothetical protein ABIR79_21375 [Candidatus Binatia bacterium]
MTPGAVRHSGWGVRGLLVVLGALGVVLVAVIVAVPRMLGALLQQGICGASGDGASGASSPSSPWCEVDHVSFAWPARLRVEGLRLRLAAGAEPAVAVQSADVHLAPFRWLSGEEFLSVTLDGPRVVLHRQSDGSYDLLAYLRAPGPPEPESPNASHVYLTAPDPDDSAEPDYDPAAARPDLTETDDAGDGVDPNEYPSIDGSRWTRIDDPFTVIHGALTISGGTVLIVDPAAGAETSLHDVMLAVRVRTDEVITFDVSARQRGREGREGAVKANGSVAFNAGVRFWYDPAETLRRLELDAEARLAPCTVGEVDVGGDFRATVHGANATLTAAGAVNQGTASVRAEARVVPGTRAVAGELHVETQNVGLVPAFAPILAQLNPIFDVGKGKLAGRLDTAWTGGWSASPTGRQRSESRGRIEVHELALSGAPLVVALRDWLGEPGDALAGDLLAPEIRSENGRISYERMALTGRERDLTFAGAIAGDGVVRLTCEASSRRPPPGSAAAGAPLRVPIGGWVDTPRLRR